MGVVVTLRGGSGDMSKVTYDPDLDGIIANAQVGVLSEDKIPNLPASRITSGVFGIDRIPSVNQLVHTAQNNPVNMGTLAWHDGATVNITTLASDVLIVATAIHSNNNAYKYNRFRINIDDTWYSLQYESECHQTSTCSTVAIAHKIALAAGAHTIKLQGSPETVSENIGKSDIIVLELKT